MLLLDHVQIAAPPGCETAARAFYGQLLALPELEKPSPLNERGGVWFQLPNGQLHVGVESPFTPSRKAHPAFRCSDWEALRERLREAGHVTEDDAQLPGQRRFYTRDPFGNRLEILEQAAVQERVRQQFAQTAEAYLKSESHAAGGDMARLISALALRGDETTLDVATGPGHMALALAPHVNHVTGLDLTPHMLTLAAQQAAARRLANTAWVEGDAVGLPFASGEFDLVTARRAPHHFSSIPAFLAEAARVLRPGGKLGIIDQVNPEDPLADAFQETVERLRDASHVRALTPAGWRVALAGAGFTVITAAVQDDPQDLNVYLARAKTPEPRRLAIDALLECAPAPVLEANGYRRDAHGWSFVKRRLILTAARGA